MNSFIWFMALKTEVQTQALGFYGKYVNNHRLCYFSQWVDSVSELQSSVNMFNHIVPGHIGCNPLCTRTKVKRKNICLHKLTLHYRSDINPLTTGPNYIPVFMFVLAYLVLSLKLKIKRDINRQNLKIVDLHLVKSEIFSLTWSCGSGQRDTTSSGWKFQLNILAT